MKYTVKDFRNQFPNDDVCLDYLLTVRYGGKEGDCSKCSKKANFSRILGRKNYACSWCGAHISPAANTVFSKSDTPLTTWFLAIFLMSQSKNGVAAKEIERLTGVTYKCAWRMMHQIRKLMEQGGSLFGGMVEADETYVGGKRRGARGRGAKGKTPVFGIVERGGDVYAKVVENVKAKTIMPLIRENVQIGANVMTDEFCIYKGSTKAGYKHDTVNHGAEEYVRGDVHTNTIEGFWSQLKRGIDGTHHSVSGKYLQKYVDEFAFRYNHRNDLKHLFDLLLGQISQHAQVA
jgi:transposase